MRPATTGPCRASPVHRSFAAAASNRPKDRGGLPSGRVWSSRRTKCRAGSAPKVPSRSKRPGSPQPARRCGRGLALERGRQLQHRGGRARLGVPRGGHQRVEPTPAPGQDPPVDRDPRELHALPERAGVLGGSELADQPTTLTGTQFGVGGLTDQGIAEQPDLTSPRSAPSRAPSAAGVLPCCLRHRGPPAPRPITVVIGMAEAFGAAIRCPGSTRVGRRAGSQQPAGAGEEGPRTPTPGEARTTGRPPPPRPPRRGPHRRPTRSAPAPRRPHQGADQPGEQHPHALRAPGKRRSQPRTVLTGRPATTATRRCPRPLLCPAARHRSPRPRPPAARAGVTPRAQLTGAARAAQLPADQELVDLERVRTYHQQRVPLHAPSDGPPFRPRIGEGRCFHDVVTLSSPTKKGNPPGCPDQTSSPRTTPYSRPSSDSASSFNTGDVAITLMLRFELVDRVWRGVPTVRSGRVGSTRPRSACSNAGDSASWSLRLLTCVWAQGSVLSTSRTN